eukprot:scaffold242058_cov29-Tisochrysis_lutea.AAC.6
MSLTILYFYTLHHCEGEDPESRLEREDPRFNPPGTEGRETEHSAREARTGRAANGRDSPDA